MEVQTRQYERNEFRTAHQVKTQTKLDICIDNIIKKEGYITYEVKKTNLSSNGGNYLGVLYEIDVKGKTIDGDKETAIFIKSIDLDHASMELISLTDVYKRELFVYKELARIIEEVQEDANVPAKDRFVIVKSYDESYNEAIIMENLTRKGFKTWYRMDVITEDMADLCVKELAKLHGLSFVLENKRPEYFNKKLRTLNTAMNTGKYWAEFTVKMYNDSLACIDKELKGKVEKKIAVILDKYVGYLLDEKTQLCLCHGDYRPSNIMIKETDGKITEAIPVDYQLIYYGCPVMDFFYFIYTSTDYQFRKTHLDRLKDLYHDSMKNFLKYFDIDINSVFPNSLFENIYKERMDLGLMLTILYGPFMFVTEDGAPDVTKESLSEWKMKLDDCFKDRLEGAIQECLEWGLL